MDRRTVNPLRLFGESLRQFAIGFLPAMVLAFACVAIQYSVPILLGSVWHTFVAPKPQPNIHDFLNSLGQVDARDRLHDLIGRTSMVSILFFFHALVALLVTAYLLRRRSGFDRVAVLRRAARGAGILTCAAAVVLGAAFVLDDILPATRFASFNFGAAAMLTLWFAATALLLPARLMGHVPAVASGFLRTTLIVTLTLVPWFYASELLGAPLRHCRECGGLFEGGCFFYPLLGAYLLGLTVSSAAVSAAACAESRRLTPILHT